MLRTEIGHDKRPVKEITLTGLPEFVDERATLDAQKAIVVWLTPKPKAPFGTRPSRSRLRSSRHLRMFT